VIETAEVQSQIVSQYVADMAKYASPAEAVKIRSAYTSLPAQLGKENHKFQYKVVRKGGSAAMFGAALDWLNQAGVVLTCRLTEQGTQPLAVNVDLSAFKLYSADTGLLTLAAGVRLSDVLTGENHPFQGALAENYVAQQLTVRHPELFYWTSGNQAEVDFVLQDQTGVTAIEVKSGTHTRALSLTQFIKRYEPTRAIRFSLRPFGPRETITPVPLYAAHLV
jgi:hypothetical protein